MARRSFIIGAGSLALAGCSVAAGRQLQSRAQQEPAKPAPLIYAAMPYETYPLPAVDMRRFDERFWRSEVDYPTYEEPGTIVVDTPARYLYHVKEGGRAMRYGIGVGRDGFAWSGRAVVQYKREWPRWTPPDEMVARQPELEPYSIRNGGMDPGLRNPLGARALYIFKDGKDTIYRLHGTPESWTIGKAVSSGCIRLVNQDIIHLHSEVKNGSPIVVIQDPAHSMVAIG